MVIAELRQQRQQKLGAPPAPTLAAQRHRAFATRQQRHRRRKRLPMATDFTHQRSHHLGHLASLAGHGIAQDHRPDASLLEDLRTRFEAAMGRGDQAIIDPRKERITRFGRLVHLAARTPLEMACNAGGRNDPPARHHLDRLPISGGIRGAGPRGDRRHIVAGDIRDHQRADPGACRLGQSPALDARQMLANQIHVLDRRATGQQLAGQRLEIGHRNACDRQREQARAASRDQYQQEVIAIQGRRIAENRCRRLLASLVGHRMSGLDDIDALGRQAMFVAGDDSTGQPVGMGPGEFDCAGHRRGRLARADHQGAAGGRLGKMCRENPQRIGRGDRSGEAVDQPQSISVILSRRIHRPS